MEKYILVSYELKGKTGQIIVKEGTAEERIKEYCTIDRLEKDQEKLKRKVNILKQEG